MALQNPSPSAFGRAGRTRAPSNPTSPHSSALPLSGGASFSSLGSPQYPTSTAHSRPHSRTQSYATPHQSRDQAQRFASPESPDGLDFSSFAAVSSLPMPRPDFAAPGSDSDSEDDADAAGSALGLVLDRSAASSAASLEPLDRLDALQRANAELGKKLMDAERTLQDKLADHESELEEMQGRLEEARSELSATKREEKELRSKEVGFSGFHLHFCRCFLLSAFALLFFPSLCLFPGY